MCARFRRIRWRGGQVCRGARTLVSLFVHAGTGAVDAPACSDSYHYTTLPMAGNSCRPLRQRSVCPSYTPARSWLAETASSACSDPLATARQLKKRRNTFSRLRPMDGVPQSRLAGNQPLPPASCKISSTSGTTMPVLSNSSSYTRLLAPNCRRMMASAAGRMPSVSGP